MAEEENKTVCGPSVKNIDLLHLALSNMHEAAFLVDKDARFLFVNDEVCRVLGYDRAELLQLTVPDINPDFPADRWPAHWNRLKELGSDTFEGRRRTRDGRVFPVEINSNYFEHEGHGYILSIAHDITQRRKMEQQILQSQKMDAIGSLAGGVAHDFNNILTAIIGYGNILKMKLKPGDPLLTYVDSILSSSERAAQLTKSLLAFGRKQVMHPAPIRLNTLVWNLSDILKRLIGEDIEFTTRLDETDPVVKADAGQIEQVLMNLSANARDAMPDGGRLSIATGRAEMTSEFVTAQGFGMPGMYAAIEVADSGTGMDENTREKIFEPFFTTKALGKGTGLGLALVYGIVKQHDGYIVVSSAQGKGTTFRIYLPLFLPKAGELAAGTAPPPRGGGETILLVEDDDIVRTLTKTVLENAGYRTIIAVDGQDGVEKFETHGREIDLLILDVIMPRKSGKEVYDAVAKERPDLDVLFTSGYPADMIDRKGILDNKSRLMLKPISPSELLRAIREILDRKR